MKNIKKALGCLLLFFIAASSISAFAQVTISAKNIKIKQVIRQIEKNSGYSFFYSDDFLDLDKIISIDIKNESIDEALNKVFKGMDINYAIGENRQVMLTTGKKNEKTPAQSQNKKKYSGIVKDELGEPIIGASVKVKDSTLGNITDADGRFSIETVPGSVLIISYMGFMPEEIKLGNSTNLDIIIKEDSKLLDEVVVVGYGSQKKINLTGAVAQVKGEALENRSVTNVSQALQGQVANLNITSQSGEPGSTQSINIRGYSGLGSTSTPLIVIDGIQGGNLNTINMNDVESISVLKDAASAAIYGSSAPYGVILVTTKKGKRGQKATITYSNNLSFAQPINLPKMVNSLVWAETFNEAERNANLTPSFTETTIQRMRDYQTGIITDETESNLSWGNDSWKDNEGNANNDWFKIYYKDFSFSQQHNIGVSGGTDKSNYFIGLGYVEQGGMYNYGDDSYKRYNARTNLSTELAKWISFNFKGAFSRRDSDYPTIYPGAVGADPAANYMQEIGRMWPNRPFLLPDGTHRAEILLLEEGGRSKTTIDDAILTGEFVVRPAKGWDITANYTYDGAYWNRSFHTKTVYRTLPSGAKTVIPVSTPNTFRRAFDKNQKHTINLFSSYEKEINGHSFKALAGYTQELFDNLNAAAGNNYLFSDELPSVSLTYGTERTVSDAVSQLAIRGGFGRINYNYQSKYLIELNGRYDASSRFLKDARYKFYPGVSVGWVTSSESFWEPLQSTVNFFKFRASYGSLGDQNFTGNYPFYPSLGTVAATSTQWLFGNVRETAISNPGLVNPYLTWITVTTLDFGSDFGFLKNRLNLTFDWYKRNATDFVGPAKSLPAILGTSAPQTNSAEIETKGFELSLGWRDQIKDFSYEVKAVLSDYQGKVVRYPNPNRIITNWYDGQTMGEIWGYETVSLFQNEDEIFLSADQSKINANQWKPGDVRYADLNGDGVIDWGKNTVDDSGDKKIIGNNTPRYSFGITMNTAYKGFDFTLFLQGVGKRDAYPPTNIYGFASNYFFGIVGDVWQSSVFEQHLDRWSETNPGGYLPRAYMNSENNKNTQTQTRYLQNAAYLRVKNMQLGYSLPKSLLSKIDFQKVRFFVNIENLATFTKLMKTMDPEFGLSDGKVYPLQRTWACGVNVTF